MVERSMFGGITGALVVQNKPSLLLLAQAYSRLCVHVLVCVCVYMSVFMYSMYAFVSVYSEMIGCLFVS